MRHMRSMFGNLGVNARVHSIDYGPCFTANVNIYKECTSFLYWVCPFQQRNNNDAWYAFCSLCSYALSFVFLAPSPKFLLVWHFLSRCISGHCLSSSPIFSWRNQISPDSSTHNSSIIVLFSSLPLFTYLPLCNYPYYLSLTPDLPKFIHPSHPPILTKTDTRQIRVNLKTNKTCSKYLFTKKGKPVDRNYLLIRF